MVGLLHMLAVSFFLVRALLLFVFAKAFRETVPEEQSECDRRCLAASVGL